MQPPEGPPSCTALKLRSLDATANFIYYILRLSPMGISTRPRLIFPARANTLVPLLVSLPLTAKAHLRLLSRHVSQSFNIVDVGGSH